MAERALVGVRGLIVLACVGLFAGCGEGRPKLVKVEGTVTFEGKPLEQGTVVFIPKEGRTASAMVVDGRLTDLMTYEPGDGLPLGTHVVTVQSVKNAGDMYAPRESLIPEKFGNPKTSGLSVTITGSGQAPLVIDLK